MRIYVDMYLLFEFTISELLAEKREVHRSASDVHRWQRKDKQEAKYSPSVHRSASDVNRWAEVG
jgi:hypothetical protein